MDGPQRVPYSQKALENLATALGVNSAAIWFNPSTSRIDCKETRRDEDLDEVVEAEE